MKYLAILRGVNVDSKRIKMACLKEFFDIYYENVKNLIQKR